MNREFTIKQNELTSKIDETTASVEEIKKTFLRTMVDIYDLRARMAVLEIWRKKLN